MSRPKNFFKGIVFLLFLVFLGFFCFWFRKFLSANRTTKNPKTSRKTKNTKKNKGFSGMSGPRTLFRGIVFFCFPRVFWVLGSGSFHRLLGPPKTQKPRGKPKKKQHSVLRNVWAPFFRRIGFFFCCFIFLCFLVFVFLVLVAAPPNQKSKLFSFKPYHP